MGIPTMTDRAMQALYLLALAPIAETTGDPNSYGFRIERSTADAMGQLFVCLSKRLSAKWVLEADIKGCFDHINHDWLIHHVPTDKMVLRKWLKAGVIHKGQLRQRMPVHLKVGLSRRPWQTWCWMAWKHSSSDIWA